MMPNYAMFIFSALLYCYSTQEITIKDFSYKHSNKSCTNVMIKDMDVVEFTCLVNYSEEPDVNYVIFQTKKTTETRFIFLTDCNIKEGCKDSQTAHGIQIGNDTIEITVRVKAKSSLSGAKLRGLLYTPSNKPKTTSEVIFPHIKDLNDAEGKLIINGKTITPLTVCHEVITRPELNIVFVCESQGSPCLIEISTDGSNETSQERGNATWKKDYPSQSEVNVLIKYGACNLNGISKSVSCQLNFDYRSTTDENGSSSNLILWSLCLVLFVMILMMMIVFRQLLRCTKEKFRHFIGTRRSQAVKYLAECSNETEFFSIDTKKQDDESSTEIYIDLDMESNPNNKSARRRRPVNDKLCQDTAKMRYPVKDMFFIEPKNLMQDFMSCQKKEKHDSFIPIFKFSKDNFPPMYDTSDLFDLIKCISELTVKVTVNFISNKRPILYPGTEHTYPFHEKRGHYLIRLGTGLVKSVIRTENCHTCPCHKCRHSGNASKVWGKICIATAKSLVFDDSEAQKSTFKINFNEENGRYHYVDGSSVTQSDIHTDQCEVECVTCDEGLLNLLYSKPNKCLRKMADVNSKYNKFKDKEKITVIVSHPHGCPKHVSIGHWTKRLVVGNDVSRQYTKYVYTAPTCPGCIGAFVYILGASDISLKQHVHCGVNEEMNNFSSTGVEETCKTKYDF